MTSPTAKERSIPEIPDFIVEWCGSSRKYRVRIRRELRVVQRALDQARRGCAYSPAYPYITTIENALAEAIKACRVKNWEGRK